MSDRRAAGTGAATGQAPPLAATILAAGRGQRLGGCAKATLQIGGVSLLERLVAALQGAGMASVRVVVGPYREQLLPLIARSGAQALLHHLAEPSLVASQRLALDAHLAHAAGHDLLLVLADLALLGTADIVPLLSAWHRRAPAIQALLPVVDGVRGHPLLLSACAVKQVAALPRHLGVRDWLQQHPEAVQTWVTDQRAHVTDVDTPQDVAALQALLAPLAVRWPATSMPSPAERPATASPRPH